MHIAGYISACTLAHTPTTVHNMSTTHLYFEKVRDSAKAPSAHSELIGLNIYSSADVTVKKDGCAVVHTGLAIKLPAGHIGRFAVAPLLSLEGIACLAELFDNSYTGEVFISLANHGEQDKEIKAGDVVAILLCEPVTLPKPLEVQSLSLVQEDEVGTN